MFSSKTKWALGLGLVFLLILTTNLIDRTNFLRVSESIGTLYEDRLVAKGLVYDMNTVVTRKRLALAEEDAAYFREGYRDDTSELHELIGAFAQTKLTSKEEHTFARLQTDVATLERLEATFSESSDAFEETTALEKTIRAAHDAVVADLFDLSRIQLDEGERVRAMASRDMGTIDLLTQIEVFFLVAIAIAVLVLLLYSPRRDSTDP